MEDIRAELKSYGRLVAIIFSGVVVPDGGEGEGGEGEGDGEGCSMVVSVYDVVSGSLVTVSLYCFFRYLIDDVEGVLRCH